MEDSGTIPRLWRGVEEAGTSTGIDEIEAVARRIEKDEDDGLNLKCLEEEGGILLQLP